MTIGNKIKDIRIKNKLSQKDFAKYLGVSQQSIALYENDKRTPSVAILNRMRAVFGLEYSDFTPKIENTPCDTSKQLFLNSNNEFIENVLSITLAQENQRDIFVYILSDYIEDLNYWLMSNNLDVSVYLNKHIWIDPDDINLIGLYMSKLNGNGRKEALKRMEELTQLDKYIRIDK